MGQRIAELASATLIHEQLKLQAFLINERRGASRRFSLELPAAGPSPLINSALSNEERIAFTRFHFEENWAKTGRWGRRMKKYNNEPINGRRTMSNNQTSLSFP